MEDDAIAMRWITWYMHTVATILGQAQNEIMETVLLSRAHISTKYIASHFSIAGGSEIE